MEIEAYFEHYSAAELLQLLKSGKVTSLELTEHYISKVKAHSHLNALILPLFEHALEQAKFADACFAKGESLGVLHGLPITIKECFDYLDTPSTFGLINRKQDFPRNNDMYVEALISEGAIVLGKSNVSQIVSFIEANNPVYGKTIHAKNKDFSSGGSSGGEGVLVGNFLSPLGLGNDIGGSIRVPAAFNGACGIKASKNRLPDQTRLCDIHEKLPVTSVAGPIAQDAESLAIAISIMNKMAATKWHVEPLRDFKDIDISSLNIGYYKDDGIFPCSAAVKSGIDSALHILRELGAQLTEFTPPKLSVAERIFYQSMSLNEAQLLLEPLANDKAVSQLSLLTAIAKSPKFVKAWLTSILPLLGQKHAARTLKYLFTKFLEDSEELEKERKAYEKDVIDAMDGSDIGPLDAFISPISPVPGYLHNAFKDMGLAGTYGLVNNVTGFPAGVAKVGEVTPELSKRAIKQNTFDLAIRKANQCITKSKGLPLSVQVAARPNREDVVLALINVLHRNT